jgi:hypothetical protein
VVFVVNHLMSMLNVGYLSVCIEFMYYRIEFEMFFQLNVVEIEWSNNPKTYVNYVFEYCVYIVVEVITF